MTFLAISIAATALACSSVVTPTTGGTGGAGGAGGSGGAPPVVCTSRVLDHAAACPAPCAITEDVEITCDDREFAGPGLRVAPAPGATWLATTSDRERMVYRIASGEAVRTDDGLPLTYARTILTLALGNDGAPHLATDATTIDGTTSPVGYPGGAEHAVFAGGTWTSSLVFDRPDKFVPVTDLEIGADGAPRVWVVGDAPDVLDLATPAANGGWKTEPASPPQGGGGWRRGTLTATDRPAMLDFTQSGDAWQLTTKIDGKEAALGAQVTSSFPNTYAVTHAPAPASVVASGPALAAAIQHDDALRVAWPDAATYVELALPTSDLLKTDCDGGWNNGCPAPCHDLASGVDTDAFAIARTADGLIWVAFVRTQLDRQLHYQESCNPEPGCSCSSTLDSDATTATLHLVRIDPVTAKANEVLALPITALQAFNLFSDLWTPVRWVDLRGFGSDLAIGLRTRAAGDLEAAVRVLRVDTTLFAPGPP